MIQKVLANTVDDEVEELVLFVKEQGNRQVANLLLRVLARRNEVDSFEMTKINIPAQNINVQELADVFLLVVAAEVPVLELLSNIGELLVDSLLLELAGAGISQIGNELDQAAHVGGAAARAAQEATPRRRHVGRLYRGRERNPESRLVLAPFPRSAARLGFAENVAGGFVTRAQFECPFYVVTEVA